MDVLFFTLARLANGTFHVARPLTRPNRHQKIIKCAACEETARNKGANSSSAKPNNKSLGKKH